MIEVSNTFVVTLEEDEARRNHIRDHLPATGISQFEFVDATHYRSESVKQMYDDGKVHEYPGCFRCGKMECSCANNIIIPQQVANWLSFIKIWKRCALQPDKFFMICEDDVYFRQGAGSQLRGVFASLESKNENMLIRMAASGENPNGVIQSGDYQITDRVVMSNAAYILNGRMAQLLITEFDRIETTSDLWLHRDIAKRADVLALTIEPLLATDLSYNREYARFASRIHPKGIDEIDERKKLNHIKRAENYADYQTIRNGWFN